MSIAARLHASSAPGTVPCLLCGERAVVVGAGVHRAAKCRTCGLEFVTPPMAEPRGVALQVDCMVHDDSGRSGSFDAIERELRARLGGPGSILDVGCASGPFMVLLRDRGWTPRGIDVNPRAVAAAQARGLDVALGTVEQVATPEVRFDAAVLMNALEYFPAALDTLGRLAELIRPGGAVAVETPNTLYHQRQAAIGRRLGLPRERLMMVEARPGRRLIAFAPTSARLALERSGFTDVRVRPAMPRHAGSVVDVGLRRAVFGVTGALAWLTRRRLMLSPSLIVTATRA